MRFIFLFCLICIVTFPSNLLFAQSNSKSKKTVFQKAHDRKIVEEEFRKTDAKKFQVKVYTVDDKAVTGRTHHWFLKLADNDGKPLNFARTKLDGYLKSDPKVKFNYDGVVFSLCSEGKYIIGFVKVQHSGIWVLEASIDNFGKKDTFEWEIEIKDKELQ